MSRSATARNFIVGIVFLGSLLVVGVVTIQVTGLGLPGQTMDVKVRFDRVNGLKTGDEVQWRGYRIGSILNIHADLGPGAAPPPPGGRQARILATWNPAAAEEVRQAREQFYQLVGDGFEAYSVDQDGERAGFLSQFDRSARRILFLWPRRPVLVTIRIHKEVELTRDTRFQVKSSGPLGGNYLEILPGTGEVRAGDTVFQGSSPAPLFDEIGDMVRENRAAIRDSIDQLRDAVRAINEREGALGALIRSPELRDHVESVMTDAANVLRAIREGRGSLGMLIMDSEVRDQWKDISAKVRDVVNDIHAGKGPIGMLVNDSEVRDQWKEITAQVREVVNDIHAGKGTVGMLLQDSATARKVKESVESAQELIAKVNEGDGTLGQVINNREAWDRLVFVLREVQEAVEDFREQAPIGTFTNAIFSAF